MPHYIHLTDEEDLILLQLSQSTAPRRIRMRAEVLRLSHRRWTAPRIAEFLHCDLKTVRETFRRWWDAGFEGLNEQEGRGRKARWSEEDLDFLAQQMSENPQTYTTEQLVQLLKTQRQVDLSPSYLSRLLKKGFAWKRVKRSPPEIDPQLKQHKREELEKLERAHEEGYIHLKYQDEAGISTEGVLGYSWMKKGEQKRVISVCKSRKRLSVLGVIERGTSFSYSLVSGGINSEQYLQFMEQEVRVAHEEFLKTGRLTVVVQDNWSVHKSKEVKKRLWEWWKKGLLVFYQPPYSPQMNRIEGEWLHLKYGELRGRCFANEEEVEAAFDAAVEHRYKQKSYKVRKVTIN